MTRGFDDQVKLNIVMEFVDNGTLQDKVNEARSLNRLFPEPLVLSWVSQIILAVQYLHSKNILHRYVTSSIACSTPASPSLVLPVVPTSSCPGVSECCCSPLAQFVAYVSHRCMFSSRGCAGRACSRAT